MGIFNLLLVIAGLVGPMFALPNQDWPTDQRIIGGTDSVYGRHPYICSLQHLNEHICGSVIYNQKTLITAAHCVERKQPGNLRVICGEFRLYEKDSHEQIIPVKDFLMHEGYETAGNGDGIYPNDVALLELQSALTYTSHVENATIARGSDILERNCQLLGWGRTGEAMDPAPTLQEVAMHQLEHTECKKFKNSLGAGQICFLNEGRNDSACHYDSGGPAVCGSLVVGVTSSGAVDATPQMRCIPTTPNIYMRLSHFDFWIRRHAFH